MSPSLLPRWFSVPTSTCPSFPLSFLNREPKSVYHTIHNANVIVLYTRHCHVDLRWGFFFFSTVCAQVADKGIVERKRCFVVHGDNVHLATWLGQQRGLQQTKLQPNTFRQVALFTPKRIVQFFFYPNYLIKQISTFKTKFPF